MNSRFLFHRSSFQVRRTSPLVIQILKEVWWGGEWEKCQKRLAGSVQSPSHYRWWARLWMSYTSPPPPPIIYLTSPKYASHPPGKWGGEGGWMDTDRLLLPLQINVCLKKSQKACRRAAGCGHSACAAVRTHARWKWRRGNALPSFISARHGKSKWKMW